MNILNSYISTNVIRGYLLILLIFLSLFSFFVFVEELDNVLDNVGVGNYQLLDACQFVAMTTPHRVVYLAPFTALLGSIIALGGLANTNELVAMQALGISPRRIAWAVIQVGIAFMVLTMTLEEWVSPPLEQRAQIQKALKLSGSNTLQSQNGFWFRDDFQYIKVQNIRFGKMLEGIDIYQFNDQGQLLSSTHAQEAHLHNTQQWMLKNIHQNIIGKQGVSVHHLDTLLWDSQLSSEELNVLVVPPETLPPSDLYDFIRYLEKSGKNSNRYELIFWEKVGRPLTTGAMVFLAIPFVFGPLRTATMGKRILIGSGVGLTIYFISQILGQMGLLWEIRPSVTTMAPILCTLMASVVLWRRI
jgi:lipopolysaccharide export system permease protein